MYKESTDSYHFQSKIHLKFYFEHKLKRDKKKSIYTSGCRVSKHEFYVQDLSHILFISGLRKIKKILSDSVLVTEVETTLY